MRQFFVDQCVVPIACVSHQKFPRLPATSSMWVWLPARWTRSFGVPSSFGKNHEPALRRLWNINVFPKRTRFPPPVSLSERHTVQADNQHPVVDKKHRVQCVIKGKSFSCVSHEANLPCRARNTIWLQIAPTRVIHNVWPSKRSPTSWTVKF